ncbi:MAG: sulfotransferase, partial [Steroidobacteraceae bacterium]
MTPEYRYLGNVLRLIGKNEPKKTWVLKCPTHTICAHDLLKVFPDARLVFMHRDPAAVVSSISSMVYKLRCLSEGEKTRPERCGEQMLDNLDYAIRRLLDVRAQHSDNFMDVRYTDFIADPVKGVRAVYARFDIPFTSATAAGIAGWFRDNPPGKHGSHRYTPEDFGLTADGIRRRFDYYRDY